MRPGFDPWVGKIPWRRKQQPTLVFLPGKSHGWRSLAGYSPWGCKEADMTAWLTHAPNAEHLGLLAAYLLSFCPVMLWFIWGQRGLQWVASKEGQHPSVPQVTLLSLELQFLPHPLQPATPLMCLCHAQSIWEAQKHAHPLTGRPPQGWTWELAGGSCWQWAVATPSHLLSSPS